MRIIRNGIILAIVTGIAVAVPLVLNSVLKDRIRYENNKIMIDSIETVLPHSEYDNDLVASCRVPNQLFGNIKHVYRAVKDEVIVAYALVSVAKGYQSDITILTVINPAGTILGLKILSQYETPGIGDLIVTVKGWVDKFIGKDVSYARTRKWAVTSDGGTFDKFTGATITPRAVVNEIKSNMLEIVNQISQKPQVFDTWNQCKNK